MDRDVLESLTSDYLDLRMNRAQIKAYEDMLKIEPNVARKLRKIFFFYTLSEEDIELFIEAADAMEDANFDAISEEADFHEARHIVGFDHFFNKDPQGEVADTIETLKEARLINMLIGRHCMRNNYISAMTEKDNLKDLDKRLKADPDIRTQAEIFLSFMWIRGGLKPDHKPFIDVIIKKEGEGYEYIRDTLIIEFLHTLDPTYTGPDNFFGDKKTPAINNDAQLYFHDQHKNDLEWQVRFAELAKRINGESTYRRAINWLKDQSALTMPPNIVGSFAKNLEDQLNKVETDKVVPVHAGVKSGLDFS